MLEGGEGEVAAGWNLMLRMLEIPLLNPSLFFHSLLLERKETNAALNSIKPFSSLCFLMYLIISEIVDT